MDVVNSILMLWSTVNIRYTLSYGTERNSVSRVFAYSGFLWKNSLHYRFEGWNISPQSFALKFFCYKTCIFCLLSSLNPAYSVFSRILLFCNLKANKELFEYYFATLKLPRNCVSECLSHMKYISYKPIFPVYITEF